MLCDINKFLKDSSGRYFALCYKILDPIEYLVYFIEDDVQGDPYKWVDVLTNPKSAGMGGFMMELEKEGDDVFIWSDQWEGGRDRNPNAYRVNRELLLKLIWEWKELQGKKPDEIHLIVYKDGFSLDGIFYDSNKLYEIEFFNKHDGMYETRGQVFGTIGELRTFLIHEAHPRPEKWINFLKDLDNDYLATKTMNIEKINDYAYLSYVRRDCRSLEQAFKIKIETLIELIEKWQELAKEDCRVLILRKKGESISLTSKYRKGYAPKGSLFSGQSRSIE